MHPAANLPVVARENGARLVIINKGGTPLDSIADIRIDGAAGVVLPVALEKADL